MAVTFEKIELPPIWVINLKTSSKRRQYITRHLDTLGLEYELIEGVDGSRLTEEELSAAYSPEKAFERLGRQLSPGEIGCGLSHLVLYDKLISEDLEEAIILEDDAQISPDVIEILGKKASFPRDWEVILFYHRKDESAYISYWKRKKIFRHYKFVKFVSDPWGTCGYMIRQSASKAFGGCWRC